METKTLIEENKITSLDISIEKTNNFSNEKNNKPLQISPEEIVSFNVRGQVFSTTKQTLSRYPNSMLNIMATSNKFGHLIDKNGNFFIDRNSEYFDRILDVFQQDGSFISFILLSLDDKKRNEFEKELLYYGLDNIIPAIKINVQRNFCNVKQTFPYTTIPDFIVNNYNNNDNCLKYLDMESRAELTFNGLIFKIDLESSTKYDRFLLTNKVYVWRSIDKGWVELSCYQLFSEIMLIIKNNVLNNEGLYITKKTVEKIMICLFNYHVENFNIIEKCKL